MKDEKRKTKPQTSIGCTAETLEKVVQFGIKYSAHKKQRFANYEILEVLITVGIGYLEQSFEPKS